LQELHLPHREGLSVLAIRKILFPVDFSEQCAGAARYVEALAGRFEAEIMLLHVVANGERVLACELQDARQAQLDSFLADELKYFTTHRQCVPGDAATEIVKAARSWKPDLVMMPTHGVGSFRRLLLGSVTAKVLHDVNCPVWTSVHAEGAPRLEQITCAKVMCAVDLGERSRAVVEWASALAGEYAAPLGIVHAIPPVEASAAARYLDQEYVVDLTVAAKCRIAAIQGVAGTDAEVFVDAGETAKLVRCAAKEFRADVLVIGRHSQQGLAGHLRHNAYGILRESPCPVISL
jgi:nucleotide-binding universal stress UspA family protein